MIKASRKALVNKAVAYDNTEIGNMPNELMNHPEQFSG